jgi:DNA-binding MarR family transcriptional regulator
MAGKSGLLDEIRQRRPFRSLFHEGTVALMRTADAVRRVHAAAIEPAGVTVQQYNVLRILRGAGKDGLPTLEIAARMIEQTPGITRLLDKLEAAGFVRRERRARDRRQVLCYITPAGLDVLRGLDGPVDRADQAALDALDRKEIQQLLDLLNRIRSAN